MTTSKQDNLDTNLSNNSFSWLNKYAKAYPINGDSVKVLKEPSEFYEELIKGAKTSEKRIVMSALYLGTDEKEDKLVKTIENSLKSKDLEVSFLFDFCRGSRGQINSRTSLLPLLEKYSENVKVSLFHSPLLRGVFKKCLGERFNEVVGLQHTKVYVFDDTVVLSGANLSTEYFKKRQDRYVVFEKCQELADYFENLVGAISSFSYSLNSKNEVEFSLECPENPIDGNFEKFAEFARTKIEQVDFTKQINYKESFDTLVYPTVQIGCLGIKNDQVLTSELLKRFKNDSKVTITTAYFNLTEEYSNFVANAKYKSDIIIASPEANGFLGSSGPSGYIPSTYIKVTQLFRDLLLQKKRLEDINILEYKRPEWTYHAKGIWYQKNNESLPSLTVLGSSNFGYRSIYRDIESQVTIVTSNAKLQKSFNEERLAILKHSQIVSDKTFKQNRYRVPFFINYIANFLKHYL